MRGLGPALVAGGLLAHAAPAAAQAHNVPLGGRTATMAAAVAEGHDEAMPLVNPAGIAGVSRLSLGLSASLYAWSSQSVDGFNAPNGFDPALFNRVAITRDDVEAESLVTVPSAVGLFAHVPLGEHHLVLGASALMPYHRTLTTAARLEASLLSVNGTLRSTAQLTERGQDLYLGPTVALAVGERLRLGLSAFAVRRTRYLQLERRSEYTMQGGNDVGIAEVSQAVDATVTDAVAVAGVQVQPLDHLWLGAGAMSPSLGVEGDERRIDAATLFFTTSNPALPSGAVFDDAAREVALSLRVQPRVFLGLAWVVPHAWGVAADATWHLPSGGAEHASGTFRSARTVSGSATRATGGAYERERSLDGSLDWAVGGEAWVASWLALRAGVSQAHDTRQQVSPVEDAYLARRDVLTISAGLGFDIVGVDTTAGAALQLESGSMVVRDLYGTAPDPANPVPRYSQRDLTGTTLIFVLSGTISKEEAEGQLHDRAEPLGPRLLP